MTSKLLHVVATVRAVFKQFEIFYRTSRLLTSQCLTSSDQKSSPSQIFHAASAFASVADRESIIAAAADAYCFILKDVAPEILVAVLRRIADGQRPLLPASSDWAVSREQRNGAIGEIEKINPFAEFRAKGANVLTVLTEREREIVRLVSEGLSNKAIARQLNTSHGTVKVHLHHIYQKLEINNRTVLARLAISPP
jgi:two-component system, NarL family, nitrate/nitrite response regulator NarL